MSNEGIWREVKLIYETPTHITTNSVLSEHVHTLFLLIIPSKRSKPKISTHKTYINNNEFLLISEKKYYFTFQPFRRIISKTFSSFVVVVFFVVKVLYILLYFLFPLFFACFSLCAYRKKSRYECFF